MGHGVYEVGEGNDRSGQANRRAVQSCDEDLGMGIESMGEFEVVSDESPDQVLCITAQVASATSSINVRATVSVSVPVQGGFRATYAEKKRPVPASTVKKMSSFLAISRRNCAILKYCGWLKALSDLGAFSLIMPILPRYSSVTTLSEPAESAIVEGLMP